MKTTIAFLFAVSLGLSQPLLAAQDYDDWEDAWGSEAETGPQWHGFTELGLGRDQDGDLTLAEIRLRLESEWQTDTQRWVFKGDLYYDEVTESFESDIRDLSLSFSVGQRLDVRAGRQVMTWGTGDFLFLNDLFPKDFQSFFNGRDDEYLKAPSTTLKGSLYGEWINLDLAWTPVFEADNFLTGERFAFFSPPAGAIVTPQPHLHAEEPEKTFANGELAARLHANLKGTEYALYLYRGFFKQPSSVTLAGDPTFSRLNVYGASVRTSLIRGIANAELAYHDSREDPDGDNGRVPNSEWRVLLGYEQELIRNLTASGQYYLEWLQDHDKLLASSAAPQFEKEQWRHLLTLRLTYRTRQQKLTWSLFSFYSPSDEDYYLRPSISYRGSDLWRLTAGANLFGGAMPHTFFGQLEDNSNAYIRGRFSF